MVAAQGVRWRGISARRDYLANKESPIRQAVYQILNALAGSFLAEHGIGIDKRESLARYTSPEKLEIMRNIKKILDPKDIMNPGKVLASADKS